MATNQQIAEQLDLLFVIVSKSESGLLIDELEGQAQLNLTRRTLQRRLDMLAEQGRITTTGGGRATRYQSTGTASTTNYEKPAHVRQRDLFVPQNTD